MTSETVLVKCGQNADNPRGEVLINLSDYDPEEHTTVADYEKQVAEARARFSKEGTGLKNPPVPNLEGVPHLPPDATNTLPAGSTDAPVTSQVPAQDQQAAPGPEGSQDQAAASQTDVSKPQTEKKHKKDK